MGKKKGQKKGGHLDDEWCENPSKRIQFSLLPYTGRMTRRYLRCWTKQK